MKKILYIILPLIIISLLVVGYINTTYKSGKALFDIAECKYIDVKTSNALSRITDKEAIDGICDSVVSTKYKKADVSQKDNGMAVSFVTENGTITFTLGHGWIDYNNTTYKFDSALYYWVFDEIYYTDLKENISVLS